MKKGRTALFSALGILLFQDVVALRKVDAQEETVEAKEELVEEVKKVDERLPKNVKLPQITEKSIAPDFEDTYIIPKNETVTVDNGEILDCSLIIVQGTLKVGFDGEVNCEDLQIEGIVEPQGSIKIAPAGSLQIQKDGVLRISGDSTSAEIRGDIFVEAGGKMEVNADAFFDGKIEAAEGSSFILASDPELYDVLFVEIERLIIKTTHVEISGDKERLPYIKRLELFEDIPLAGVSVDVLQAAEIPDISNCNISSIEIIG